MISRAVAVRGLAGLLLTSAGLIAGVLIVRIPAMDAITIDARQTQAVVNQLHQEYEVQLSKSRTRADRAENELLIERSNRLELEKSFARTQIELGYVRDQLAFFEELLPPGPSGSIRLRSADFDLVEAGLSYRVLLMRSGKVSERFCGRLQFVATGAKDGTEDVSVVLEPLRIDSTGQVLRLESGQAGEPSLAHEGLALEFSRFQRSQGFLALPEGFQPKFVTVRVLNGSIVLASRRVDL